MQPIPDDILSQFNVLLDKRSVPAAFHEDYRKWLRYFLDYRERYSPPAERSEQVRLFVEKLRSKGQSGKSLHHAAHALSLFFSLRSKGAQAAAQASETRSTGSPSVVLSAPAEAQPSEQVAPTGEEIRQTIPAAARSSVQRPGGNTTSGGP